MAKAKTQTETKTDEKVVETPEVQEVNEPEVNEPEEKTNDGVVDDETQNSESEEQVQHDLSIVEVYEKAQSGAKFKRKGWSKQVGEVYVTVLRGETKLSLVKAGMSIPYTPSHDDAVTVDWYEVEEEEK